MLKKNNFYFEPKMWRYSIVDEWIHKEILEES